jgi:hypothetical protein
MKANTRFKAVMERGGEAVNSGYFLRVPPEVSAALGAKGQLRVVATIEGADYRLSLARYGGVHWLGLRAEVRQAIGKAPGDEVEVALRPDLEPRLVGLPPELEAELAGDASAREAFDGLSYSHRKEHADFVAEAKKPETRLRRARKAVDALRAEALKRRP